MPRRKTEPPPAAYDGIERAVLRLDAAEGSPWVAARLEEVDHPVAREAVVLLRSGRRAAAHRLLERTLHEMAGPPPDWSASRSRAC
jgi:hypothetical protein